MVMEMSKTYQYRKVMKPLLERKRRARINKCLDDLKDLMVECLQQEGEHVTRLEKADILELTVEHMRKLKQRGGLSLQPAQTHAHVESFRSGYVHAADQITQVLLQQRQSDEVGGKIMKFLSTRLIDMQQQLVRSSAAVPNFNLNYAAPSSPLAVCPDFGRATSETFSDSLHSYRMAKDPHDDIDVTSVDSSADSDSASVDFSAVWRPW